MSFNLIPPDYVKNALNSNAMDVFEWLLQLKEKIVGIYQFGSKPIYRYRLAKLLGKGEYLFVIDIITDFSREDGIAKLIGDSELAMFYIPSHINPLPNLCPI